MDCIIILKIFEKTNDISQFFLKDQGLSFFEIPIISYSIFIIIYQLINPHNNQLIQMIHQLGLENQNAMLFLQLYPSEASCQYCIFIA